MPTSLIFTILESPIKLTLWHSKIYFQKFPGKHGTRQDRGIANVDYTVRSGGRILSQGKTDTEGAVNLLAPESAPVELEIFNTRYQIVPLKSLDEKTSTKGLQQRLALLGFDPGNTDGILCKETDLAVLHFEANANLDPEGVILDQINPETFECLATEFGE